MDKQKQPPSSAGKKPNAAPRDLVDGLVKRIAALGMTIHDAVEKAGQGRATGYRFLRYEASLASYSELDEWVKREELKKPRASEQKLDGKMREWAQLGQELHDMDVDRFDTALDELRRVVDALHTLSGGKVLAFRVNPDRSR